MIIMIVEKTAPNESEAPEHYKILSVSGFLGRERDKMEDGARHTCKGGL